MLSGLVIKECQEKIKKRSNTTTTTTSLLCLVFCLLPFIAESCLRRAEPIALVERFQHRRRLLIVSARATNELRYVQQMSDIYQHDCDYAVRHFTVLSILGVSGAHTMKLRKDDFYYKGVNTMYSGFNNAPHLHTGDVSITELLQIRYELDLRNERDIHIVLIDYNGKVKQKFVGLTPTSSIMSRIDQTLKRQEEDNNQRLQNIKCPHSRPPGLRINSYEYNV